MSLNKDKKLSYLLRFLSSGSEDVTSNIRHFLNSGNCLSVGVPISPRAALDKTSLPKNLAPMPSACAPNCPACATPGVLANRYDTGLIATILAACKPLPATYADGFITPYFVAFASAGPTNGNMPPTMAPSAPKRNLFCSSAIVSSLPLMFFVSMKS